MFGITLLSAGIGSAAPGDVDGDTVANDVDVDDDNDGILDAAESPGCYFTEEEALTLVSVSSDLNFNGNSPLANAHDGDASTFARYVDRQDIDGQSVVEFTLRAPVELTSIHIQHTTNVQIIEDDVGVQKAAAKFQGWDGSAWVDLTADFDETIITSDIVLTQNTGAYEKYRLYGIDGRTDGAARMGEISFTPAAGYNPSLNPKSGTCADDADGDGIPNHQDLDSDNDTIADNVEAQTSAGYTAPGTFVDADGDGLNDVYSPGLSPVDSDFDGDPDYLDLNSDGTGDPDIVEVGNGGDDTDGDGMTDNSVGINGLDDTHESTDSFSDVNGDINDPSTLPDSELPGGEVDYRDIDSDTDGDGISNSVDLDDDNDGISDAEEGLMFYSQAELDGPSGRNAQPGDPLNICSNSGYGGINQNRFKNLRDKLTNPAYFGPGGEVSESTFVFKVITSNEPTLSDLDSNDCDIWFSGWDTGDGNFEALQQFTDNGGFVMAGCDASGARDAACEGVGRPVTNYSNIAIEPSNDSPLNPLKCSADINSITTSGGASSHFNDYNSTDVVLARYSNSAAYPAIITNDMSDPRYLLTADINMWDSISGVTSGPDVTSDQDKTIVGTWKFAADAVTGLSAKAGGAPCEKIGNRDTDGDGISDLVESDQDASAVDTDNDGVHDSMIDPSAGDTDDDGLVDVADGDNGGADVDPIDTDSDGRDDYLDLDSDGDLIPDTVEARPTGGFTANDGDLTDNDQDGDGVVDTFDANDGTGAFGGTFAAPEDSDGDGDPDYLDEDSDDDGLPDLDESGLVVSGSDSDMTALMTRSTLDMLTRMVI